MPIVKQGQLGARFRHHHKNMIRSLESGMVEAALRGERVAAEATPVNTGLARAAWRVRATPRGADLVNDAPHAGVLEMGSRPHRPPFFPILQWVVMKQRGAGIADASEATPEERSIAYGVVLYIEEWGTDAHRMVGGNLFVLRKLAIKASERAIRRANQKEG